MCNLLYLGKAACHKIYGEPIAINAGSAAYFIGQISVYNADIADEKKLRIYHMYFETLRAAHSGQALDLYGLDYMMDDVVENGKGDLLVQRSLAIHRLKSAAPASYLAKIGAILGEGTEEQVEGLGLYYDALGVAFQIIDDTLNLKGYKDGLKTKGEDITSGKITDGLCYCVLLLLFAGNRLFFLLLHILLRNSFKPVLKNHLAFCFFSHRYSLLFLPDLLIFLLTVISFSRLTLVRVLHLNRIGLLSV